MSGCKWWGGREEGVLGEEGGGDVQRMDKVLQRMLRGWRLEEEEDAMLALQGLLRRSEVLLRLASGGCV